jgi:carboxypeptidase C (cathepsin A)
MQRLLVRASVGLCLAIGLIAVPAAIRAQDPPTTQSGAKADAKTPPTPTEEWSRTTHTITIGGKPIPYRSSAGTTLLTNDAGDPTGLLYSVAYTRTDVTDPSTRPVAFLYNGGPGSATMWLHMGAFGPRRVATTNGGFTPPAPYSLVDNTESLLDKTDLVFIDAMGTGYSRAAGKGEEKDFYGVDEDAAAFAQFIVTYLSRNNRWNSPKFLIGESYGTFRSAVLGNLLQSRYNVHLNGIDLISSVLDLSTSTFADGDDRVYEYYLPSYAAVAWYF